MKLPNLQKYPFSSFLIISDFLFLVVLSLVVSRVPHVTSCRLAIEYKNISIDIDGIATKYKIPGNKQRNSWKRSFKIIYQYSVSYWNSTLWIKGLFPWFIVEFVEMITKLRDSYTSSFFIRANSTSFENKNQQTSINKRSYQILLTYTLCLSWNLSSSDRMRS